MPSRNNSITSPNLDFKLKDSSYWNGKTNLQYPQTDIVIDDGLDSIPNRKYNFKNALQMHFLTILLKLPKIIGYYIDPSLKNSEPRFRST